MKLINFITTPTAGSIVNKLEYASLPSSIHKAINARGQRLHRTVVSKVLWSLARGALRCGTRGLSLAALVSPLVIGGCGPSNGGTPSTSVSKAQVRFVEGAPVLEALVNGAPQDIGSTAYLSVNGATVATSFLYGTRTPFVALPAGTLSLTALDSLGYAVGPVNTTAALTAGKSYTVVLVGAYPTYRALTFEEPAATSDAQLAVYEASPSFRSADFGSFKASTNANYKKLGTAQFGDVVTVSLGKRVSNFGGYAGSGTHPLPNGAVTPVSVDGFDTANVLPFNGAGRLSLFVFDPKPGSGIGPVFGSLDQ